MSKILLVEDDLALQRGLRDLLLAEHFLVDVAENGEDAIDLALTDGYDVVLLDVVLPKMSGYDVAMALRTHKILTPIIMLTAKDHIADRVQGLDSGADDYLIKPFASTELFARIRAQIRRSSTEFQGLESLTFANMTYRGSTRELTIGDETGQLSPKEAILIELFLRYPSMVLTRSQLMARLWSDGSDILDNALEAHVSKLRRKLLAAGGPDIVAVRGLGYRLERRV